MQSNVPSHAQEQNTRPLSAAIFLYEGMPAIEAVAPYEALSLVPNVVVKTVAETAGPKRCDSGMMTIVADYALDEVHHPDIFVIPGGNIQGLIHNDHVLSWIRTAHETSLYSAAMCVGSLLLGAAGLLQGVHVATLQGIELPSFGEIRVPGSIVADGKIVTGTNAAVGLDLGIYLAVKIAGDQIARAVQIGLEYDLDNWKPPYAPRLVEDVKPEEFQTFMEIMRVNPRMAALQAIDDTTQAIVSAEK